MISLAPEPSASDSSNQFEVVKKGDAIIIKSLIKPGNAVSFTALKDNKKIHMVAELEQSSIELTEAEAMNLAAWIVCMADPSGDKFARLVSQIKKS